MVWPLEASRCVLPSVNGTTVGVDDGGPDVGFVSDPQQLITRELAAITGFRQTRLGEQAVDPDGDDDRRRDPTHRRLITDSPAKLLILNPRT
jgi:hypothetical protein